MLREGFVFIDRRKNQEAAFELKKALAINPGCLFARGNLGVLYEDQILQITPEDKTIPKRLKRIS